MEIAIAIIIQNIEIAILAICLYFTNKSISRIEKMVLRSEMDLLEFIEAERNSKR